MSYVALDSHPETFSYSRHNDTKMSKKLIQIPKMVLKKVLGSLQLLILSVPGHKRLLLVVLLLTSFLFQVTFLKKLQNDFEVRDWSE